eukprot:TRINITY_DN51388_c0_g1_i1.p1 TRINITY_DN51388_c0_g1~~TRINITY_DN51388_c0_g1_i1.p1  ORF type:complete len:210 (+),score=25.23 TRINITY_DN51388_c0_g1_i1:38-667(+)
MPRAGKKGHKDQSPALGVHAGKVNRQQKSKTMAFARKEAQNKAMRQRLFEYKQTLKEMGMEPSNRIQRMSDDLAMKKEKMDMQTNPKLRKMKKKKEKKQRMRAELDGTGGSSKVQDTPLSRLALQNNVRDPLVKARQKFEQRQAEKSEHMRKKQIAAAVKEKEIAQAEKERKRTHKRLSTRGKNGQPVMSMQVDNLLARVTKQPTQKKT